MASLAGLPSCNQKPQLQAVWQDALSHFKTLLREDEYAKVVSISCPEDLTAQVRHLSERYKRRRVSRVLRRMDQFFIELGRFSHVINMYVQADTKVSALVFGTTYMILEVAARHRTYLQDVVDMLDHIHRHFPRFHNYAELLVNCRRIEDAIAGLYRELISFCVYAIDFLTRKPLVNLLRLAFPQNSLQTRFEGTLTSIRAHGDWIDREANAAFHERKFHTDAIRHKEVLDRLPMPPIPTHCTSNKYRVLPQLENREFHGRTADLENLAKILLSSPIDGLLIHSIIGLSGVGKSQLALKFLYQNLHHFEGVFWVSADKESKLARGFADIANEIGATQRESDLPLDALREMVKRWLKTTDCKWLLVLDNVISLDRVHPYLPIGANGRIILTSQTRETTHNPITSSTWLQPLCPEEGAALLVSMLPEAVTLAKETLEIAAKFSIACGGLPLALSRGAGYIRNSHSSIQDLLRQSTSVYDKSSILDKSPHQGYFHKGDLSELWDPSINYLTPPARYLANLFVFFDLDTIPTNLIKLQAAIHPDVQTQLTDENIYHESLMALFSRLLVTENADPGNLNMHSLIQVTLEKRLTSGERHFYFGTALEVINKNFPTQDHGERLVNRWELCGQMLPHVLRLCYLHKKYGCSASLHASYVFGDLLERTAWYLQERGQLDQAMELLEHSEAIANTSLETLQNPRGENIMTATDQLEGKLQELLADILGQYACIQYFYCKFEGALGLWERSILLKKSLKPPPMGEISYLLCNAGNALINLNRLEKAYKLFQESFKIRQEELESSANPQALRDPLASNYGCLSGCLWQMRKLDEALQMANQSTELCVQVYGEDGPVLATCYTTLGNIKYDQGEVDEAEKLFLRALNIRLKELGDHYKTAMTLHKVAGLVRRKGNTEIALQYLQSAITIFRKFPKHTAGLARSLFYLSTFPNCDDHLKPQEEAFQLYKIHCPSINIDPSSISIEHFDDLVNRFDR